MKAVVIGSGFGGLAIALRLLAKGYAVTVLEARERVGGRAYQLKEQGYTFDMGPSLVTAPALFDELFGLFNEQKSDYFSLVPLDPFYRIYFQKKEDQGFAMLNYNGNPVEMRQELEKLEEGAGKQYDDYFKATRPIFEASYEKYGGQAFLEWWKFLKIFPEMLRLGALLPMTTFVGRYFKSDFARRTFSFHPLYIGSNPFSAPAALGFIPWLEREQGVWFAMGGMYQIVSALAELFVKHGGVIKCGERVKELRSEISGTKTGKGMMTEVVTDHNKYPCDLVVSNADVLKTYEWIDRPTRQVVAHQKQLARKDYSMSLLMLYLGLKRQYHDKLAHHTLILGTEYHKLLEEIFNRKVTPTSLSMYLHIPTITDATMAPEGCESMYILIPVPNLGGSFQWNAELETRLRNWVVEYLEQTFGLEGFAESIEFEKRMTPEHFATDLQSTYGAAFGPQLTLTQSVYLRQHNRADEYENLYFVGAGTHPGPGVPGVLLTAKATADLIPNMT